MGVYNRIYTIDKWNKVSDYNKELMEDFLLELKSQKKKKGTIDQYKNDLRILFIYILDELNNKPICNLKKKHFRNYSLWLSEEKNMSNARVNRMLSALRSMLEYATDSEDFEDDIEINYAAKVKGLGKEAVRDIVFLSMEEISIIYEKLIDKQKYQQATLLAIMTDSACRRSEAYQILRNSITPENSFANMVVGKRGKRYRPLINDMTKEAFKLYDTHRGEDDIESMWVTADINGVKRKASKEILYTWVISWRKILEQETGIYKEFNAHSFRHSVLELLSEGEHYICHKLHGKRFSLDELKLLANHESIETTSGYLKNKDSDLLLEAFGLN